MIIPDVNLLLYATVAGFPQHERARAWWQDVLNGPEPVGLASPAVFGYLRVATNGRVLSPPMSVAEALAQVRGWLAQPNATFLRPGPRHLEFCFGLLETLGTGGNLTTDVQLAAHAIEEGAELCSHDMDFGRFPDVRWVDPLRDRRPSRRVKDR